MDDIRGKKTKRQRVQLHRGADGRLRSANEGSDIGDLWAQQKRIRLAEAIEEDRKKAAREHLRKERGLVGMAKKDLSGFSAKVKVGLFGEQAIKKPKPKTESREPSTTVKRSIESDITKTVEIKIGMPSLPNMSLKKSVRRLVAPLKRKARRVPKGVFGLALSFAVVAAIIFGGYHLYKNHSGKNDNTQTTVSATQKAAVLSRGTPDYPTLLPTGKSIQSLGGWYRVSPQGKAPVYAYADKIGGVPVDVSEQPLPSNFQTDTDKQVAQLAKNFSANQKMTVDGVTVYLRTSSDNSQSVIFAKSNLLILLKATSEVAPGRWATYIKSLQ
jgi:hypothetical protein